MALNKRMSSAAFVTGASSFKRLNSEGKARGRVQILWKSLQDMLNLLCPCYM